MNSQNQMILEYLKDGNSITALQALDKFKCFRLASRIGELKSMGHKIDKQMIKVKSGKRVAKYFLI